MSRFDDEIAELERSIRRLARHGLVISVFGVVWCFGFGLVSALTGRVPLAGFHAALLVVNGWMALSFWEDRHAGE